MSELMVIMQSILNGKDDRLKKVRSVSARSVRSSGSLHRGAGGWGDVIITGFDINFTD